MNKLAVERGKHLQELEHLQVEAERSYQLSRVELERANLETLEQLGQINHAQHLEGLKNLKEIEYQIKLKGLQDDAQIYAADEVEYAKHLAKIAELKRGHEVEMKRIDGQIQVESFKTWRQIGDAISGAFSTAVKGVIMGTQSITQAMRNMAQSGFLALIDMGGKWLAQHAGDRRLRPATPKGGGPPP